MNLRELIARLLELQSIVGGEVIVTVISSPSDDEVPVLYASYATGLPSWDDGKTLTTRPRILIS